jgi:NADH:ubiquinone reductase (H+-translocating)
VRVILLDGGDEPPAGFGDQLAGKATKELEHLGVELRMGARVVGVYASGDDITDGDGSPSRLLAYTTVWAAGVEASALAKELATASGAQERARAALFSAPYARAQRGPMALRQRLRCG